MKPWKLALAVGLVGLASVAHAGLTPYTVNGDALVFDDDYTPLGASSPGLTWTADANLAATTTFGLPTGTDLGTHPGDPSGYQGIINADGTMNWPGALFWIDAMNAANYGGANNWRLWSALNSDGSPTCTGDCTDSELGHLFYGEGGLNALDAINDSAALTAVFTHMQDSYYWSSTLFPDQTNRSRFARAFETIVGRQFGDFKSEPYYAWAVRPGQVAVVPEPATGLLMTLGLAGIGWARRNRRRR